MRRLMSGVRSAQRVARPCLGVVAMFGGEVRRPAWRAVGVRSILIAMALGIATVSPLTPTAHGQPRMGMRMNAGMGAGSEKVSAGDVARYAKVLGFSAQQTEAFKALHEAYSTEYDAASKTFQDSMTKARQEFEDSRDPAVFQEILVPAGEKFGTRTKELETTLLSDLRSLLTPEQQGKWPALERAHRRSRGMLSGMLAGESVDLKATADDVLGESKPSETLSQTLDRYETELDQAMTERNTQREAASEKFPKPGQGNMFDFEAISKAMGEMRKAGIKVRDINDRYATVIAGALPENVRDDFTARVKKAKFPQVYREGYPVKAMKAAMRFEDMTGEQKSAVQELMSTYERDAKAASDVWAKAIAAAEADGGGDETFAGMSRMMGGEQAPESEVAKARKAKRAVDSAAIDKLKGILTPAQVEKLPEREVEFAGPAGFGGPPRR